METDAVIPKITISINSYSGSISCLDFWNCFPTSIIIAINLWTFLYTLLH